MLAAGRWVIPVMLDYFFKAFAVEGQWLSSSTVYEQFCSAVSNSSAPLAHEADDRAQQSMLACKALQVVNSSTSIMTSCRPGAAENADDHVPDEDLLLLQAQADTVDHGPRKNDSLPDVWLIIHACNAAHR